MGLNDNTKNIEIALTEKNKIQQEKEIAKRKEQQKKENYNRLEKEIIRQLYVDFNKIIQVKQLDYGIIFLLQNATKQQFFDRYYKQFGEQKTDKNNLCYIKNKTEITEIIQNNYSKILKQVEAEQLKQNKYIKEIKKKQKLTQEIEQNKIIIQQKQQELQNKKEEIKIQKLNRIITILFYVFIGILSTPLLLITSACKKSKK